jgi:DNA polymerase-3 subunit alpha
VRVDKARMNKRTVEALIKAGAFDACNLNRARWSRRLTGL